MQNSNLEEFKNNPKTKYLAIQYEQLLEHEPETAKYLFAQMEEIVAEVKERFGVDKVAMAHRVGTIKISEASIVIAVSAPHRKEALAACQFAIDRVKEIAPIWKKELFEDGSRWVGWGS